MVWTYSGDPSSTPKDAVRFLLGDTDPDDNLTLSDPEIDWLVSEWDNNVYFAAAAGAEQLAGQFAREVGYSSDAVQFAGDDLQSKYQTLAEQLRKEWKQKSRVASPYDGSTDFCDWWEIVDPIKIGFTDNRRDGANAPSGRYLSPLTGESDSGYASDG